MDFRRYTAAASLRYALLASLGLTAGACGGNATGEGNGGTTKLGQCTGPQTLDPRTHLPTCKEGYAHREKPTMCSASSTASPADPAPAPTMCGLEGDCSTLPNGYCSYGPAAPTCKSGCFQDTDCQTGFICSCTSSASPTGGECVPTDCATDADCGDALCTSTHEFCGEVRFACQQASDECAADSDCAQGYCIMGMSGHRECFSGACGRPFLVLTEPRLPPITARSDWNGSAQPATDHLTLTERAALAAHWTRMGQMEHASIAAFARFSLQLLSLGAPPELVDACTQALADETAHTKLCFALASAYAGRALGPGPLDVSGSLAVTSLADIVDLVIAEGCFGETGAALEALEAAQLATDPVIIAAYSQIARDEQRHAELAFRFVRWALERDPGAVTPRVVQALSEQSYSSPAVHDVVEPCLYAVLARREAA